jgi:hypothetical protein
MLTFISFWCAATIGHSDLASSAYCVGGDAEKVIGKSAPCFVLAVMLFSYAVRSIYIESSSMFVRGGVSKVVKEAMGGNLANLSVSALLFDYVLTGTISAVSAGQYLAGFTETEGREFKVPGNIHIGKVEIPIGMGLISLLLFATAVTNLFTKRLATISGVWRLAWYCLAYSLSPSMLTKRPLPASITSSNRFASTREELTADDMEVRPGDVLVAVRDPNNLAYLRDVLGPDRHRQTGRRGDDSSRLSSRASFSGNTSVDSSEVFEQYEQQLFTSVVNLGERPVSMSRCWSRLPTTSSRPSSPPPSVWNRA